MTSKGRLRFLLSLGLVMWVQSSRRIFWDDNKTFARINVISCVAVYGNTPKQV